MLVVPVAAVLVVALGTLGWASRRKGRTVNPDMADDLRRRRFEDRSRADRNSWHGS